MIQTIDTLEELAQIRLTWMELHDYSALTLASQGSHLELFLKWTTERELTKAHEITGDHLATYQRWLAYQQSEAGVPWSLRYQYEHFRTIQYWFYWSYDQGYLFTDPTVRLAPIRLPKRLPINILTQEELKNLVELPSLQSPTDLRDKALLEVLYATALRKGEVLNLNISDINTERGTLLIRKGKGKKDRLLPLATRTLYWLETYQEKAWETLAKSNAEEKALFLSRLAKRISKTTLINLTHRHIKRVAPAKSGGCLLIRRSVATALLEQGCPVEQIQALLGHRYLRTTQLYTKVRISHLREVYQRCHPGAQGADA